MDEGENADALGRYSVVKPAGCLVRSGTEMQTPFVGTVACGTVVDVGQIATLADGTMRGRVNNPRGWITLRADLVKKDDDPAAGLANPAPVGRVLGPADACIAEPLSVPAGVLFPGMPSRGATQFRVVRETGSGTVHLLLDDTARLFPEYTTKDQRGLIKALHPAGAASKQTLGPVTFIDRIDDEFKVVAEPKRCTCTRARTCARTRAHARAHTYRPARLISPPAGPPPGVVGAPII